MLQGSMQRWTWDLCGILCLNTVGSNKSIQTQSLKTHKGPLPLKLDLWPQTNAVLKQSWVESLANVQTYVHFNINIWENHSFITFLNVCYYMIWLCLCCRWQLLLRVDNINQTMNNSYFCNIVIILC